MEKIAILASWNLVQSGIDIYIPTTHFLYLKYVVQIYEKVYLISPLYKDDSPQKGKVLCFPNVKVIPLPFSGSYAGAIKNYRVYKNVLKEVMPMVDVVYCRVPDPFCWMPQLLFKKKTIMHFVGDSIDATKHNEKWSWLRKKVMIAGYLPEYALTLKAAKRSRVFTNGPHIAKILQEKGLQALPVISSTVSEKDLHDDFLPLPIEQGKVIITYVGYIRFAKGMQCLMDFCRRLRDDNINYQFHLIGNGEMYEDVQCFVEREGLKERIFLHGHIDNQMELNRILRGSDLFFFPSLSEGSPRVVIEAMSQGIPVMSTPVGSLPTTFEDGETIRFFDFNDTEKALSIVQDYMCSAEPFDKQRRSAYKMVAERFTIEKFLSKVFSYDA